MSDFDYPPPPPGISTMPMVPLQNIQYALQIRDQRIHKLHMDNVRLQLKLEQAEHDVMTAMKAMMVAYRSGNDKQHVISATDIMIPPRFRNLRETTTSELRRRTESNADVNADWGRGSSPPRS